MLPFTVQATCDLNSRCRRAREAHFRENCDPSIMEDSMKSTAKTTFHDALLSSKPRNPGYPFTEPASKPRTKYR